MGEPLDLAAAVEAQAWKANGQHQPGSEGLHGGDSTPSFSGSQACLKG